MRLEPKVGDLVEVIEGPNLGRIGLVQGFRENQRQHDAYKGVQPTRWATIQYTDQPVSSPYTHYMIVEYLRVISKG